MKPRKVTIYNPSARSTGSGAIRDDEACYVTAWIIGETRVSWLVTRDQRYVNNPIKYAKDTGIERGVCNDPSLLFYHSGEERNHRWLAKHRHLIYQKMRTALPHYNNDITFWKGMARLLGYDWKSL